MTIGGLVYGPTYGAPAPSPFSNVFVGLSGPTFTSIEWPFFVAQQVNAAVGYYRDSVVTSLPAMGDGGDPVPLPAVDAFPESKEVCWESPESGDIRCFPSGSIFEPGGTWGPDGTWFRIPDVGFDYGAVIDPAVEPYARVFEDPPQPEEIVPLHESDGWISGLTGFALDAFGNWINPIPEGPNAFMQPNVANGTVQGPAPMTAAGCPPRKTRTLTIDCATGQEVKRTRRRRRRLLTSSDLGDLAQLQALVGKGSNAMSVAVSKAIR